MERGSRLNLDSLFVVQHCLIADSLMLPKRRADGTGRPWAQPADIALGIAALPLRHCVACCAVPSRLCKRRFRVETLPVGVTHQWSELLFQVDSV